MKEFITAFNEAVVEDEAGVEPEEQYIEFAVGETDKDGKVTKRVLKAYPPHEGQMIFMLAATGRGQAKEARFAAIINIMMESMRGDDKDYLESRLLTGDPRHRLPVEQIEQIFEYLTEEWFARPTESPSGSA